MVLGTQMFGCSCSERAALVHTSMHFSLYCFSEWIKTSHSRSLLLDSLCLQTESSSLWLWGSEMKVFPYIKKWVEGKNGGGLIPRNLIGQSLETGCLQWSISEFKMSLYWLWRKVVSWCVIAVLTKWDCLSVAADKCLRDINNCSGFLIVPLRFSPLGCDLDCNTLIPVERGWAVIYWSSQILAFHHIDPASWASSPGQQMSFLTERKSPLISLCLKLHYADWPPCVWTTPQRSRGRANFSGLTQCKQKM